MTKTMKNKLTPARRNSGFTLIEMLVVAALIAIFAGLAVFNIVEQLNREKEKAALAEARSIATAMSFAYDDLGFFPKLCFLKYGLDGLKMFLVDEGMMTPTGAFNGNPAIEYFGFPNPALGTMIEKNWGEKYMSGSMPDKFVNMRFQTGAGVKEFQWPADPFRQPYVAYLVGIETPEGGGVPEPSWPDQFGGEVNYFAGIVSYGRNKVPGGQWDDQQIFNERQANRLYGQPDPNNALLFETGPAVYTQASLDLLTEESTDPQKPNIRDVGTDDKYFEF